MGLWSKVQTGGDAVRPHQGIRLPSIRPVHLIVWTDMRTGERRKPEITSSTSLYFFISYLLPNLYFLRFFCLCPALLMPKRSVTIKQRHCQFPTHSGPCLKSSTMLYRRFRPVSWGILAQIHSVRTCPIHRQKNKQNKTHKKRVAIEFPKQSGKRKERGTFWSYLLLLLVCVCVSCQKLPGQHIAVCNRRHLPVSQ